MKRLKGTLLLIIFIFSIGIVYSQEKTIPVFKTGSKATVEHKPIKKDQQNSSDKHKVVQQNKKEKKKSVIKTSRTKYNQQISLKTSKQMVLFLASGGTEQITVNTNADSFNIDLYPDWCTITKHMDYLVISCNRNNQTSSREGLVYIKAGDKIQKIYISQAKTIKPDINLSVSTQNLSFPSLGGTEKIIVYTNSDSYSIDSYPEWCTITKFNDYFIATCKNNYQSSSREGLVYIKAGDKIQKINISQLKEIKPEIKLSVSTQNLSFSSSGGTQKIIVNTNADSYITYNYPDWCTVTKYNNYIIIFCRNNDHYKPRECVFNIKAGEIIQNIRISQKERQTPGCINCPQGKKTPLGFSIGYVSKQWVYKIDNSVEKYGIWDGTENVEGVQLGLRIEPLFKGGFGINTGIFYEYYYSQSGTNTAKYTDVDRYYNYTSDFSEHSIHVPIDLEYRFNFSRHFNLFFYGGASIDYGIFSEITSTEEGDTQPYYTDDNVYDLSDYDYPVRFNASLDLGGGIRINRIQINAGVSLGKINISRRSNYIVNQNKNIIVDLSYMF